MTRADKGDGMATIGVRRDAEAAAGALPPLLVEAESVALSVATGLHGRRRGGPGETFWQHRPYTFGDPASAIDWRQSARAADRLFVRQNEWEAAAAVWFWVDASKSMDFASSTRLPTKRRRAQVLALALAILLADAGERVGVIGAARAYHGRGAPTRFIETIADDSARGADAPPVAPVGADSHVVFIGDFLDAEAALTEAALAAAGRGARGLFWQIVDPQEEDFAFNGRIDFENPEGRERRLFGDAGAARSAYRAAFAEHRAGVAELARRLQWGFLAHRTDEPAGKALAGAWLHLTDRKARRSL